jgi:hypothetical protein
MPAKAGIQTWPRVPGLWIPAFAGTTLKDLISKTRLSRTDAYRPNLDVYAAAAA